jgi:hypothetical protein
MKICEAIAILKIEKYNVNTIHNINYNELKKYYHIQCLLYHPDKNNINEDSTLIFQNINSAYNILKGVVALDTSNILDNSNDSNDGNDDNYNYNDDNNSYNGLIMNFVNFIIKYCSVNVNDNNADLKDDITNLKINANNHIKVIVAKLLSNFSLHILEDLYINILKYKTNILKYKTNESTNNIIEIIKVILEEKLSSHCIYILTPNLSNLLNNDIYKLQINSDIIYIPLWHNELNFENNIIKIEPLLGDHISIDSNNNIHYNYYTSYDKLIEMLRNSISTISIELETMIFEININELKFSMYQVHIMKKKGIPEININNILDNTKKADIYFHIYLS